MDSLKTGKKMKLLGTKRSTRMSMSTIMIENNLGIPIGVETSSGQRLSESVAPNDSLIVSGEVCPDEVFFFRLLKL
jgi:hypothetical protein